MTTAVHRDREISLFGEFYPIQNEVNQLLASKFAEKVVFGDITKESDVIRSSWISNDQRGGIGVKDGDEDIHGDRVWWSTSHLNTDGHLVLPALVTDATNPTTNADFAVGIEYENQFFAVFGNKLYRRTGIDTWSSSLGSLVAPPTAAIVHKSKVYFACGSDFNRFDGSTLTTGVALAGTAQPSRYFAEWHNNLYALDDTGQMDFSVDEGVTWITDAKALKPRGYYTSMFTYHDGSTPPQVIIYLGTKEGLLSHDNGSTEFRETELRYPFNKFAGKTEWWRESAYITSGMQVYRYTTSGQGASILEMGLDQNDGMPEEFVGHITKLIAGHNALYAFVDATSAPLTSTRTLFGAEGNGGLFDGVMSRKEGYSTIFRWSGFGWSVVYQGSATGNPVLEGAIGTANDENRLWFGIENTLKYVALPISLENPHEVSTSEFGASSTHKSFWFDNNESTETKLAAEVIGFFTGMTEDEYEKIYYGVDYDDNDDNMTLLTNDDFPDGQIDSDGEAIFELASGAGVAFKAFRFREELVRGSTNTLTPDRRWLRLAYLPTLKVKWGFTIRVDCTRNYRRRNKKAMEEDLKAALAAETMGVFQFRDGNSSETYRVKIFDMNAVVIGGKRHEGIFDVDLVAP